MVDGRTELARVDSCDFAYYFAAPEERILICALDSRLERYLSKIRLASGSALHHFSASFFA
jgi:hypothetical protein